MQSQCLKILVACTYDRAKEGQWNLSSVCFYLLSEIEGWQIGIERWGKEAVNCHQVSLRVDGLGEGHLTAGQH